MKTRITIWVLGFILVAGVARAASEDARFSGGSFDGWDRDAMTNSLVMGGAVVALSSGTNQMFELTSPYGALADLTITVEDPKGAITNGGVMRITVPTDWAARFDNTASVSFSGDAAGKVNTTGYSYTDGDRTLSIPVTSDFAADDVLVVSGLILTDLRLVALGARSLELDFDGDGSRDIYDEYTVAVRSLWSGGSFDGWDRDVMTNTLGLGGAIVSFSSGTNHVFALTSPYGALADLTITVEDPKGAITNGGVMRITVPDGSAFRFDNAASVSFSGDAAGKVNTTGYSYTDGDRTLSIPVTGDFAADDVLVVSGLILTDLRLVSVGTSSLELDFDGDGSRDVYDAYTVAVVAVWSGGSFDGWDQYAMLESKELRLDLGSVIMLR